jgi:argininosuccinate lyase
MEWQDQSADESERIISMKMWDGRFAKPSAKLLEEFNNSLPFDKELIEEDIDGSIAWAKALARIGIYNQTESRKVIKELTAIKNDWQKGHAKLLGSDEDIHMAVERLLVERVGQAGAKLHTGRSRNDQVATDTRLYCMRKINHIKNLVKEVQSALILRAESDKNIIVPGYTHLQQAQPISLAHYWMSCFFCLEREKSRLDHAYEICDIMPLGSGAIAGAGFAIDRKLLAADLGFSRISDNSIDAVASRDFALELLSSLSSLGIHLSRYAEDLIIWSSREFGYIELDDAWSTGSSMMPQKKNPDSLELMRGKAGRFLGNYTRLATTVKGIGLAYYKDLQEDKEPLFDSIKNMDLVLRVFASVLATLTVNSERMAAQLDPLLLATDVADYLTTAGLPFRQAHKVVGSIVGYCVKNKRNLMELSLKELLVFSPLFKKDIQVVFNWQAALRHRDVDGGTSLRSVNAQVKKAKMLLK